MSKQQIIDLAKKHNVTLVNYQQLQETISSVFKQSFLDNLNYLDENCDTANIQIKLFLFDLFVFEDFIKDNPDFDYEKLISGRMAHDDIDMFAFYKNHDEMANTFGYRNNFERNVQDCTYDFYLHLLTIEDQDEIKVVMVVIYEE